MLFLLLILFLWLRLRTLGLCDRDYRFLLHGLIRLPCMGWGVFCNFPGWYPNISTSFRTF